ncbi:MAG: DsbA family protein [Pseudomonadota bacterium]
MTSSVRIFSDFACPFCYLGKGIIKELQKEYDLDLTWEPYELHPETPPQGVLLADQYPDLDIRGFFERLRHSGREFGVEFGPMDFAANSGLALQAGEHARAKGRFDEYHSRVFEAYFRDGLNIGRPEVVLEIIRDLALDPDEVEQAWREKRFVSRLEDIRREARVLEIPAAPTFLFGREARRLVGAQPLEAFRRVIDQVLTSEAV